MSRLGRPVVVLAPSAPSQKQQTPSVALVAVGERRRWGRHFASQNYEGDTVKGLSAATTSYGAMNARVLGPQPPQVILPLPSQRMMTIATRLVAPAFRMTMARRRTTSVRLASVIEPRLQMPDRRLYVQVDVQAVATRIASKLRQPHSLFLTPQLLSMPPPTARVAVTLANIRRDWPRRDPRSVLSPPAVVEPSLIGSDPRLTLRTRLQALPTRQSMLRRETFSRIFPPATLEPYSVALRNRTPQIDIQSLPTRQSMVRRGPISRLSPPATLEPYSAALRLRTLQVDTQALPTRQATQRRATHSRLAPPAVTEPSLRMPDRRLFVQVDVQSLPTRASLVRRAPFSRLYPPATLQAVVAAPVVTTITVAFAGRTRVELQRRAQRSRLSAPAVVEPSLLGSDRRLTLNTELQAVATRNSFMRRRPMSILAPAATLEPAAVALRERTIDVTLIAPQTRLGRTQRAPHSRLYPPATLQPESVVLQQETVGVTLSGRTRSELGRRAPHSLLHAPAVVQQALQAPDRRLTIPTPFAPQPRQPRRTHAFYRGPVVYPATSALAVSLAGRTRTELQRRGPHSHLSPPTVLTVFAGPRVSSVQIRTRTEAGRRAPHFHLAPPAVVLPLPSRAQQTLLAVSTALRTRIEHGRHVPFSVLQPPAVALPPASLDRETLLVRFKQAVWMRIGLRERRPHYVLNPPAVVRPQRFVVWRLSPDSGWSVTAAPRNEWRVTAEPIDGWIVEPDLP